MNFSSKNHEHRNAIGYGISKSLKSVAIAFAFAFTTLAFAGVNPDETDKPETMSQALAELLSSPELDLPVDEDVVVEFNVNDKNEIIVLSVDTDDYFLKRFIKFRLNYEKLNDNLVKSKNHFKVLVKFSELD